jgi:hypothetical protein
VRLDGAVRLAIERAGRDLEQRPARGVAPLAHEEHPILGVDRDDADAARMSGDVAGRAVAVRCLDRVDAELENPAPAEDLGGDERLAQRVVRRCVPGRGTAGLPLAHP